MLLRLRVALPDRPGSLGNVARALGLVGADIVSVVVLERSGGRAVDDFTVVWPASAPLDRVVSGIAAVPGVRVDGVWRATELPEPGGRDVAIVGQVAVNPDRGLATLVDAMPGVLAAEWAMLLGIPSEWALRSTGRPAGGTIMISSTWRAPSDLPRAEITPLRSRAMTAADGTHLVVAPFRHGGLVLVVARGGPGGDAGAPPFDRSEIERLTQIVGAAAAVLGDRLVASANEIALTA